MVPPYPVNWSPTHLTSPQTLFFYRYLNNGCSNPKISKNEVHFFSNFASGRTIPTHSTGPQPIQLVPKHCFYRYLGNGGSNQKNSKNKVHLFFNFATGRTLPTQSTGPQPIQLVPKHFFLQISIAKRLFLAILCYGPPPMHPPPPWAGGGRLGEFTVCTVCVEKQKTTKNGQMAAGRVKMSERVN